MCACVFLVPVCHVCWENPRLPWPTVEPFLRSWYTTHHHSLWWIYHTVGGPLCRKYYFNTDSRTQHIWWRKTVVSYRQCSAQRYRINFFFKLLWCFYFECTLYIPLMIFLQHVLKMNSMNSDTKNVFINNLNLLGLLGSCLVYEKTQWKPLELNRKLLSDT